MLSFIRYGVTGPAKGTTWLNYIEKRRDDIFNFVKRYGSVRKSYEALRDFYRWHKPPMGVYGVYAFVNTDANIDVYYLPTRYLEQALDIIGRNQRVDYDHFTRYTTVLENAGVAQVIKSSQITSPEKLSTDDTLYQVKEVFIELK